jgi:hypothetical protein
VAIKKFFRISAWICSFISFETALSHLWRIHVPFDILKEFEDNMQGSLHSLQRVRQYDYED